MNRRKIAYTIFKKDLNFTHCASLKLWHKGNSMWVEFHRRKTLY